VDDDVDVASERALEPGLVAHVADEERKARVAEGELHVMLLELVAAEGR